MRWDPHPFTHSHTSHILNGIAITLHAPQLTCALCRFLLGHICCQQLTATHFNTLQHTVERICGNLTKYRALRMEYRALRMEYRALLMEYRAQLMEYRALLMETLHEQ